MKKSLMTLMVCLAVPLAWCKSFSVDLRQPTVKNGVRVKAQLRTEPAVTDDFWCLRRVNLDAGTADVGKVAVGDELTFTLFDDVVITLTLKKQMPSLLGGDVFLAEASGYGGVKNAVVIRTVDGLTIDVQDFRNKKVYKVISTPTGVMVQELEVKNGKCGCDALESPDMAGKASTKSHKVKRAVAGEVTGKTETYVDILVAYDKNAVTWANSNGGGVTNFAQVAVQKMNSALVNSGLKDVFQFRLVGVVCVETASNDLQYVLNAAVQGMDEWAPIKIKRDEVYADIVSVLIDTGEANGTTGLGWSLESTSSASFSEYAYNVCSIRAVEENDTMTHEVGHNMGAGHSDMQIDSPGPQYYSYSAGYYFSKGDASYHTIMAYDSDGMSSRQYSPVPYFSTPGMTFEGVRVGDSTHDNAKTLLNTFAIVAEFRSPPDVSVNEDVAMPIGNFFGFEWRTSKSRPWTNYDAKYPATQYAAELHSGEFRKFDDIDGSPYPSWDGSKPDTGSTWLETTVAGPVRMSFFHSVYMANGPFTISVDGSVKYFTRTSNTDTFLWADVDIPEGEHDVRLTFVSNGWFCGYDTFNGIELYDVRTDTLKTRPVITPVSSCTEENATTFWESCEVKITNAVPGTTIYYTLDDTWPNIPRKRHVGSDEDSAMGYYEKPLSECQVYTGPFTVTNSVVVKAVAVQADGTLTMTDVSLLLKRQKVRVGEWTTDAVGAVESAAEDGKMVLVRYARSAIREFTGRDFSTEAECTYVAATESNEFLSWAKSKGVYLVEYYSPYLMYTRPRRFENGLAEQLYNSMCPDSGDYPALVFSRAWMPYTGVGKIDLETKGVKIGSVVYDGTTTSIIAILEQYLEERPQKNVNVMLNPGAVGELAMNKLTLSSGEKFGKLPIPQVKASEPSCYRFIGWYARDNSEWFRREWYSNCGFSYMGSFMVQEDDIVPYTDVELIAQWKWVGIPVVFMGRFGLWQYYYYVPGEPYGELPLDSYLTYSYGDTFTGWYTKLEGGEMVTADSILPITATDYSVTNYAHWTQVDAKPDPLPGTMPQFSKAQTIDGALYKGDVLVGTMQVKIGKISRKGVVKVSATATLLVDGKAKKVTAKAVNVMLGGVGSVPPVPVTFKAPIGEMMFEMHEDGAFTLKNASYVMSMASIGGALQGGSQGTFRLADFGLTVPGELQEKLLPYEEAFSVSGARWSFAKAATVKWAKPKKGSERPDIFEEATGKGLIVDDTKGKTNRSGLKLTYTAKTGIFKGSFKAYALEEKNGKMKLVKYTVNVIGLVVNGEGVGQASCKRPVGGPWAVSVE